MLKNIRSAQRVIFFVLILFASALCHSFTAKSQDVLLPMNHVNAMLDPKTLGVNNHGNPIYRKGIINGRYMEDDINGQCAEASFAQWEGFPLKRCTYRQSDKNVPSGKIATVIMLNPEKELLAKWLVASCVIVKGNTGIRSCAKKLAMQVMLASGSQFAVAGIVLEDMNNENIQHAYTFRDGVTVMLQGGLDVGFSGVLTESANILALDPNTTVQSTASERAPARIQSTSRKMYRKYKGSNAQDVTGTKWLDVVRTLYQDAWKRGHDNSLPETVEKYRNDLMVAKCYDLMGIQPTG
jgi:hypothetical protein